MTQNRKVNLQPATLKMTAWLTFMAIILLAFFFRFYRLADYPLGIFFDPAINGLDAIRLMQRGGPVIFFPTNVHNTRFSVQIMADLFKVGNK